MIETLKGLLTPLIAVITAYIAWQQWKTNERRFKLDRYDRRFRVYKDVIEFIALACQDFKPSWPDIIRFHRAIAEADFLFGSDISAYLNELSDQVVACRVAHLEYDHFQQQPPTGDEHRRVMDEMHKGSTWLSTQHQAAKQKFQKYLDVSR
jgi:hypothetical protein